MKTNRLTPQQQALMLEILQFGFATGATHRYECLRAYLAAYPDNFQDVIAAAVAFERECTYIPEGHEALEQMDDKEIFDTIMQYPVREDYDLARRLEQEVANTRELTRALKALVSRDVAAVRELSAGRLAMLIGCHDTQVEDLLTRIINNQPSPEPLVDEDLTELKKFVNALIFGTTLDGISLGEIAYILGHSVNENTFARKHVDQFVERIGGYDN